jgi:hypothetical protein
VNPVDHAIDLDDHLLKALPGWLQLRPELATQPDSVSFLEALGFRQKVTRDSPPQLWAWDVRCHTSSTIFQCCSSSVASSTTV